MSKMTQLEKAIAAIDADIHVLEAAKARLLKEQQAKPRKAAKKAKPEAVAVEDALRTLTAAGR